MERKVFGAAAARGALVGFDELYQEQWWPMLRLATGLVDQRAAAEDVVQDAFEQLHRRWSALRKPSSALDYARSAVLNGCRSVHRRRLVARRHEPQIAASAWRDTDTAAAIAQRTELIDAFRALPRRQREVLALRYYLDMSVADVATTLHISPSAVRSTASRGLDALARILPSRAAKEP
jgi:RNA polymerase sigma-70 factor (sigma-E family)